MAVKKLCQLPTYRICVAGTGGKMSNVLYVEGIKAYDGIGRSRVQSAQPQIQGVEDTGGGR